MPAPGPASAVDLVDAADQPIGRIPRAQVFRPGVGFRVAHVFVFNRAGNLLLQQLGHRRDRNPLKWGSSVAGYLHAGETYAAAAARRLNEELSITAPLVKQGEMVMVDQGAQKFVALFSAVTERYTINEPLHIETLRFAPMSEVAARLEQAPEEFTETFRLVFRFYRSLKELATSQP